MFIAVESGGARWLLIRYLRGVRSIQAMLTGSELLAKVKEIGDASKSDLVRGCGYLSTKKDGSERLNFTAFYEALLEAKGVSLGEGGGKTPGGKGGAQAELRGHGAGQRQPAGGQGLHGSAGSQAG
jgi:hypothetical protein